MYVPFRLLCFRYYSKVFQVYLAESEGFSVESLKSGKQISFLKKSYRKHKQKPDSVSCQTETELVNSNEYIESSFNLCEIPLRRGISIKADELDSAKSKSVCNFKKSETNIMCEEEGGDKDVGKKEITENLPKPSSFNERYNEIEADTKNLTEQASINIEYYPIWEKSTMVFHNKSKSGCSSDESNTSTFNTNSVYNDASIYETLYPIKSDEAPPLPPRTHVHKPLERLRALPYWIDPPEDPRKGKSLPCSSLPIKKLIEVEDSFNFDLIDTDEVVSDDTNSFPGTASISNSFCSNWTLEPKEFENNVTGEGHEILKPCSVILDNTSKKYLVLENIVPEDITLLGSGLNVRNSYNVSPERSFQEVSDGCELLKTENNSVLLDEHSNLLASKQICENTDITPLQTTSNNKERAGKL